MTQPIKIVDGLYISDIDGVRHGDTSKFDRVVSVCQDECSENVACEYNHFKLADGPNDLQGHVPGKYSYELLKDAINTVVKARQNQEKVLVHCHAGQSRSVAVCIGTLVLVEGMSYNKAFNKLRETKNIHPNPEILKDVKRYITKK